MGKGGLGFKKRVSFLLLSLLLSGLDSRAWAHESCIDALTAKQWAEQNKVVFQSPGRMDQPLQAAELIAQTDANVLLDGETGAGKEVIARMIHDLSQRRAHPYGIVDSTNVPGKGYAFFFGSKKGAFTDAETEVGVFEAAQGGTVFIDEIGKLSLEAQKTVVAFIKMQASLRYVAPLGDEAHPRNANIRIIAATNIDLEREVQEGRFRRELFDALSGAVIRLAPLRERKAEILPLAMKFLKEFNEEFGREIAEFSPEARLILEGYAWPGNVRELKHLIQLAVIHSRADARELNFERGEGAEPVMIRDRRVDRTIALENMAPQLMKQGLYGFVESPSMHSVLADIWRVTRADRDVLIIGEAGLGKEKIANAAHEVGLRSSRKMIVVQCGALEPNLIQSILFGHGKGAFTGAISEKNGLIAEADGSDLLINGIDELDLETQGRLLRFLNDRPNQRKIQRMGRGQREIPVNVRVIATSSQDLRELIRKGKFREDLFFRLGQGGEHRILPLRDRPEDIWALARHSLNEWNETYGKAYGRRFMGFDAEAQTFFASYSWPGNISQLNAVIHRNCADPGNSGAWLHFFDKPNCLGTCEPAAPSRAPISLLEASSGNFFQKVASYDLDSFRKVLLQGALILKGGNQTAAASRLGMCKQFLNRQVKSYGLNEWLSGLKFFQFKDFDLPLALAAKYLEDHSTENIEEISDQFILFVLDQRQHHKMDAASSLGRSRSWLDNKLKRIERQRSADSR